MRAWLIALLTLLAGPAAAQECSARLFVSGYFSTVHVYDACSGSYLRDLDLRSRLFGAMAVRLGPDGLLYAVAEEGGFVHKYRNDTLEYVGVFADVQAIGATGLVFDAGGVAYVAGYQTSDVRRFSRTGEALGPAFPASALLRGPDNGLTFGPDGNLYVPGYDTSNVLRWDPRTGQSSVAVAARTGGLLNTRGLLPARGGQDVFITSEGSGRVLRWNLASGAISTLATGLSRPTGIDYALDGKLLVSSGDSVVRIDPDSGANLGTFIPSGLGGLSGQVFVAVIPRTTASATVDASQVGTQYWIAGDARFEGRVLQVDGAFSATGSAFGPQLRFADLAIKRWGSVRIELTSCTTARFSWDSTGSGSAGFGAGSYEAVRYFENEATARCRASGMDAPDKSWVNGMWWGGTSRAGEGFTLDRNADGTTFLAWFTHRPR